MNLLCSISSILNSHFLLALHETHALIEGAADASISSLTLETGSGEPMAGSPELPEFLGIIGGSICSFHDDDNKDLQSLEYALPQEEENQPELEGEIQEISRDEGNMA